MEANEAHSSSHTAERYAEILSEHAALPYPLDFLRGIPTKAAASKLRSDLLDVLTDDENNGEALHTQISLMESATPSFERLLAEHDKPSATDIGTATHTFLQFCDFDLLQKHGVDADCERLVRLSYISKETARILNRDQLQLFCESDLMRWINDAAHVRREQKFSLFVPLAELTKNPSLAQSLGEHTLFVQGSIDLLLEGEDGSLILVDYKTDRISDNERRDTGLLVAHMQQKHGEQLACYATAVEQMFGRRPDRIYLYSLPLGGAVLMS